MASGNEFSTIFSVEFEDLASVKAKLDVLKKKIGQSNTSGIKIDVDTSSINKMIDDINKLSKTNIQVLPDGQIRMINTLNDELGKTVKLTTDLSTGKSKIDLTNDFEKQAKEQQRLIEQMAKGRESSELKRIQNNKKLEEAQSKAINKEIESSQKLKAKEQQRLIEQMAKGRESSELKRIQNNKKLEEAQSKAINKEIESSQKLKANAKEEELNAKKLIEFEKQKLQLKQKNIELNRGSLVDKNTSKIVSDNISGLSGSTVKEVRENVRQLNLELDKLDQNARLNGVEVGQKSVSSLGDAFKSTANKMGIFLSTTIVLRELMQQMREATQYIIDMDKSMTNIMMITGRTSNEVSGITEEFKQLGSQLHTTNREMMASSEEMLRAGYDTETSKKMMEASVIGSKVSGQTSKEVSEQLIAIKNAFNMTGDEMESVIDKMARLDNTSATSFKELAEATKRTAFSAQEMGTSYSDLLAYITTASEKTRKPAETIGESLRTIYSRYSSIKLGNLDDEGKAISDVEKALGRLDIKLRDNQGSFRDFDNVLKEFMDKIKQGNVSQIDKLAIVSALAGTRQKETLLSIIENTDALKKHQDDLANSTGSAKKMFEDAYSNSLDAKINDLNRSFEGLYDSILKSSALKLGIEIPTNVINGVSSLINKFGVLPTTISTVVGALTIFNSKFRESTSFISKFVLESTGLQNKINTLNTNYSKRIEVLQAYINKTKEEISANQMAGVSTTKLSASLTMMQGQLLATTVKMAMLKVGTIALQTAMTMGLSLGISFIISKFSSLVDSMITTKAELKELNQEFNNSFSSSQDNIKNADSLVSKYESLKNQLSSLDKNTEEYKNKEQELADVQSQLVALYPQSSSAIDGNTDSKNFNIEATKNLIEQDRLLAQSKANEILSENKISNSDDVLKLADATKQYREEMQKYLNLKNQGINEIEVEEYDQFGLKVPVMKEINDLLKDSTKNYEDNKIKLDAVTNALSSLSDENVTFKGVLSTVQSMFTEETEAINENTQAKQENNNTKLNQISENGIDAIKVKSNTDEIANELVKLGFTAEEVADKMKKIDVGTATSESLIPEASESLSKAINQTEDLYNMIEKINESGSITPQILSELASKYPEMADSMFNVGDAQEWLNNKIFDMQNIQGEAISIMRGNDTDYYNELLANGDSLQQAFDALATEFVDINSASYGFDTKNFSTLNEAKSGMSESLTNAMAEYIAKFTNENSSKYQADLSNFASLNEKKSYMLQQLDNSISSIQDHYNSLITQTNQASALLNKTINTGLNTNLRHSSIDSLRDLKKGLVDEPIARIERAKANIETGFGKFISGFQKVNANYIGNTYSPSSYSGGSKGSGSKGKGGSGKSQAEKDAEKAQREAEKAEQEYQKMREQMEKDADSAINKLRTALIDSLKKQYQELKDKETQYYDKLIEDKQKELKRLQDGYVDDSEKLLKLQQEYEQWKNDNSAIGKQKREELEEQIKEVKLQIDISDLEKKKKDAEELYDVKIDNAEEEAENLINNLEKDSTYIKMTELIGNYSEEFRKEARETGQVLISLVKDAVLSAKNAFNFHRGESEDYVPSQGSDKYWFGSEFNPNQIDKNDYSTGRVRVEDSSAPFYADPYGNPTGKLQDAGIYWWDTMYITSYVNGKSGISKTPNGETVGYVDPNPKYIRRFNTGGYTGDWAGDNGKLAVLDKGEFVLNKRLTDFFIDFSKNGVDMNNQNIKSIYINDLSENIRKFNDNMSKLLKDNIRPIQILQDIDIEHTGANFDDMKMQNNLEKMIRQALRDLGIKK